MNCMHILILFSVCGCAVASHGQRIPQNLNVEKSKNISNESSATDLQSSRALLENVRSCRFAPGLIVGNRTAELRCCARVTKSYNFEWYTTSSSLTNFLETLRQWNCPQFEEQCRTREFAFTEFSGLVYDYFCNYTSMVDTCLPRLIKTVSSRLRQNSSNANNTGNYLLVTRQNTSSILRNTENSSIIIAWRRIIEQIEPSLMKIEELKEPCVGIAQYDVEEVHNGSYQEVINFLVPACGLTWFGFSAAAFRDHRISFWTGLSYGCRNRINVFIAVLVIMAVVATLVNLLVILVLSTTKQLKSSQTTYKLSLAAADLLVGIFVLPTCIYNLTEFLWFPLTTSKTRAVAGYAVVNGSFELVRENVSTNIRINLHLDRFSDSYFGGIGFLTGVSLFVSVYTLAAAGFDRLFAISKPLSYNKSKAEKYAKIACVLSWIFAVIFSLIPVITPFNVLTYGISFSLIVIAIRNLGIILYAIVLIIPLVIVWIVNISVYVSIKRHTRNFNRKLSKVSLARKNDASLEQRLATTLCLMVGVFTLNTLPLWLTILANFFIRDVRPNEPKTLNLKKTTDFITVIVVAVLLLLGNSIWNFVIYNARNKDFRTALKHIMKTTWKKLGVVTCCRASRAFIRNATGHGRRKLSSVSTSILNLNKKTGTTEEMVVEKTSTVSQQTRESVEINVSEETLGGKKDNKKHFSDLPSVSEASDSVFNSYAADIGISRFYSSVMRTVKNSIDEAAIEDR